MASPEPPREPALPALRASDADRERTVVLLRDAGGDGRLTVQELDERLDAAYAAVTRDDLAGLTADLVATTPASASSPGGTTSPGRVVVRDADDGSHWVVAIMSALTRTGAWRLGRRCTSVSFLGGADLDLTHAEFDGQEVHLRVLCLLGSTDLRVPEHMNVVVSDFAFMGGNDVRIGAGRPDPGGPTLHLHLVSVLGAATVKRGPKRSRKERRALEQAERDGRGHLPHGH